LRWSESPRNWSLKFEGLSPNTKRRRKQAREVVGCTL
jgi:hypothetical protein